VPERPELEPLDARAEAVADHGADQGAFETNEWKRHGGGIMAEHGCVRYTPRPFASSTMKHLSMSGTSE
jgi:hypothetical protein